MLDKEEKWLELCEHSHVDESFESYLNAYRKFMHSLPVHQQKKECISGFNRIYRQQYWSSESLKIDVKVGDVCYIEYGQVFINEAGYQHFGLVLGIFNYKLFVVPMTSNLGMVRQSRNVVESGKRHLYYIGRIKGLNKPSVIFLNDGKFINSARIISVNGHINPESKMFSDIKRHILEGIFGSS